MHTFLLTSHGDQGRYFLGQLETIDAAAATAGHPAIGEWNEIEPDAFRLPPLFPERAWAWVGDRGVEWVISQWPVRRVT